MPKYDSLSVASEASIQCRVVFEIASAQSASLVDSKALVISSGSPDSTPDDLLKVLLSGKTHISGVVSLTTKDGDLIDVPIRVILYNEQA